MLKLNSTHWILFVLVLVANVGRSQDCKLRITGQIVDEGTHEKLAFANIFIPATGTGAVSDLEGNFEITDLCPGDYHLRISHISCTSLQLFVELRQDSFLDIHLQHHSELLDEVVIHGHQESHRTDISATVNKNEILKSGDQLANVLKQIAGVSSLKSGTGIAKPIIHGMYGNRISVLNNGVLQGGQQWGNDHAPEIDPFMADHLSVIKGSAALAYGGGSLGGVVLADVEPISHDPHVHGELNYIFNTNGQEQIVNSSLEHASELVSWRFRASLRSGGDKKTAEYYLKNTGNRELNYASLFSKTWSDRWNSQLYYSSFRTKQGILRGAHISSLTDLQEAIHRDQPFFTEEAFSNEIGSPRQQVQHHLIKFSSQYLQDDQRAYQFTYSVQLNNRREFDVRRAGRSETASLHLKQWMHQWALDFNWSPNNKDLVKSGIYFQHTDNTNDPQTGILPLIPDYLKNTTAAYFIFQRENSSLLYDAGMRYELAYLFALPVSNSFPREVLRFKNYFSNLSISTGLKYNWSKNNYSSLNLGLVKRSPEANELYSNGLHQGVSGIERGNPLLNSEYSIKGILGHDIRIGSDVFFQANIHVQKIRDFIYLQANQEVLLTIRGAFPVFNYKQADAIFKGTDLLFSWELADGLKLIGKYAYLDSKNSETDKTVAFTPPSELSFQFNGSFSSHDKQRSHEFFIRLNKVFGADASLNEQDFLNVPSGYMLVDLGTDCNIRLFNKEFTLSVSADNLLNKKYRNYLNRQRYFADDMGRNIRMRLHFSF